MIKAIAAAGAPLALALLALQAGGPAPSSSGPDGLARVVKEVEALNALRSSLAGSFSGAPDQSTFARVCKPVGRRAKQLSQELGWTVQQLAERYRNPDHRLDREAERVYDMMEREPGLMGVWLQTEMDGVSGTRYFRRIMVEQACLACHGARDARPAFVVQAYPEDRAYGFDVGDLRGLYAVFVPDG